MSISDESKDRQICCSFCGKPQEQARRLIAGPGVYICDECIELCMSILEDEADFQERSANYHNNDETVLTEAGGNQGQIRRVCDRPGEGENRSFRGGV